jgi:hypothetical protein
VKLSLAAVGRFSNLDTIKEFADENLYLRCRQITCDEVRVNEKAQPCPRVTHSFRLNDDSGRRRSGYFFIVFKGYFRLDHETY